MTRPTRLLPRSDPRLQDRSVSLASAFSTILLSEAIGRTLPDRTDNLVLDVGGGESPYARPTSGSRHITIDRRLPSRSRATHQLQGDACALPVQSGCIDVVLCTEVLEHVEDDTALLIELRRVVARDGMLVISAPFVHGLHESPHDYRRPTSAGLLNALTRAGFDLQFMDAVGGTGDVLRDSLIREASTRVRAIERRSPRRVGEALCSSFVMFQAALARRAVGRSGRSLRNIDPLLPIPRLTLGYVAVARPM